MSKYILLLIIILISCFLFLSCGNPPDEMIPINLLDWVNNILPKINNINLNQEKQKIFAAQEIQNKKELLAFKKNNSIYIHSKHEKESGFLYSIDNNSFILKESWLISFNLE